MPRTLPIRIRTLAAAAVVVATGLMIWNAYQFIINSTDQSMATLPIIAADTQPFRVLPDDPGGVDIPNKGSRLFNVLNAENADDLALDGIKIDREDDVSGHNLAESEDGNHTGFTLPEIPENRSESLYGSANSSDDAGLEMIQAEDKAALKEKLETVIERADQTPTAIVIMDQSKSTANDEATAPTQSAFSIIPMRKPSAPSASVVKKQDVAVIETKDTSPIPTPVAAKPKTPEVVQKPVEKTPKKEFSLDRVLNKTSGGNSYIQLASVRDDAAARAAYARIRDDFPSLVAGVNVSYPQVDMGSRGVFTRIQIGPLTPEEARARCAKYTATAKGGTCLVVTR